MVDLLGLLDQYDLVVGRGTGVLGDEVLAPHRSAANELRRRRGFLGDLLVLAIAGGTGSGKSSLLNAIAGEPVASVSHLRPHTDRPLAWIPAEAGPGIDKVLDDLGVDDRVRHRAYPGLCILDLPDLDSVSEWHRTTVEDLLPRIDAVIWVFDPEKYHDPVLHEEFLRPLHPYASQFVFVLNQVDRLGGDDALIVAEDLMATLEEDGYVEPRVFSVAAAPPSGPPGGMEALTEHLAGELDAKRVGAAKLVEDVGAAARHLGDLGNVWRGTSVDFVSRWDRVKEGAAAGLAPVSGPAGIEDALCRVEDFIAAVSVETGGPFGTLVRATFPPERVEDGVAAAASAAAAVAPESPERGSKRKRAAAARTVEEAGAGVLEERIGRPLRELLWNRAVFGAEVAALGIGVAEAEAGPA
jgi:GTP-binding protein EngB required for normal cell division